MPDLKIVKTTDVNKVPIVANQLIFEDDGSFYFDYSSTLRLRNSGSGAQLHDFVSGRAYEKDDMILHEGRIYRCLITATLTEFRACDWEFICTCGEKWPVTAQEVTYDDSVTELDASTVQQAIQSISSLIHSMNQPSHYTLSIGTF